MTQPLALVVYEKLLPGSQIVNRLQDLHYRVQIVNDPALLVGCAEQSHPMLVLADLDSNQAAVETAIRELKQNSATLHLPVIAFTSQTRTEPLATEGPTMVVHESALLGHLPQFLDQALKVD